MNRHVIKAVFLAMNTGKPLIRLSDKYGPMLLTAVDPHGLCTYTARNMLDTCNHCHGVGDLWDGLCANCSWLPEYQMEGK